MVGVTVHPTMSLVLEEAPKGTLQIPLLKEQRAFSRIVMYRIAIQVASALRFLHSINIIFRDLKADNVLLWSLSPDYLINCKVTDFNISDPGGSRGLHGTVGFIAPDDYRADIFSFGMFLYQLIARCHPFHNVHPFKIEATIEEGQRPQLEDIPVAETGLFYMTRIMKLCWAGSANDRPRTSEIIEWFCAPAVQLIMSVIPISGKYHFWNGCIVIPTLSNEIRSVPIPSELWICCDGIEGVELRIFNTHTLVNVYKHFMEENQVLCMKQCGDYIWVASRAGLEYGGVNIFNKSTKDLVHNIKMTENTISCITNSDELVYMGTIEGCCFAFSVDVQSNMKSKYEYISEHCIDGIVITKTCLWVSSHNQIHFLNPNSLKLEGVEKRTKNMPALVGLMQLSDNGDQVWSAHLGGVMMSSWNAYHQCVHLCDVDVGVIAEEKCHVGDPQDQIITAMCTGLDTVWIGLASGHIVVFGMNHPGEVLTYFKPYHSCVRFLSSANYPGPCGKEECMMLSGGKMYQPDDSFKELPDFVHIDYDENGQPVDMAGVAILWEVLPAKYMQQVHYLSGGTSYMNYSTLEKTMTDTGFTESMNVFPSNYHLYHEQKFAGECDLVELLTAVYPALLLNTNEIICKSKTSDDLLADTQKAYQGHYRGQLVIIKLCTSEDKNKIKGYLKRLHSVGSIIKQLHHPCVSHLVGIIAQPTPLLVLENAHHGFLKHFLLKEGRCVPRIVVYRIAIQVASALSFLHNANIIHLKLSADNVLLCSISPDCLINCKIIAFNITNTLGSQDNQTINTFSFVNLYNFKNIYSYGEFLTLLLDLSNHMQLYHVDPLQANTNLYCLLRLCQSYLTINSYQQIIKFLSAPIQQLIMTIIPIHGTNTLSCGCIVRKSTLKSIDIWTCCNGVKGIELTIIEMAGVRNMRRANSQTSCIQQCGEYIWMASQVDFDDGVVYIFGAQMKKQIHKIHTTHCIASCITTNSSNIVYIGTEEGYCFAVPTDIQAIHSDIWSHHHKCVSEYCIDGVVLTQTHLWVSSCLFLEP